MEKVKAAKDENRAHFKAPGASAKRMEKVEAAKDENRAHFKKTGNYKDAEHPSFWECRLKPNPQYVGAADEVCVVMSDCLVVPI